MKQTARSHEGAAPGKGDLGSGMLVLVSLLAGLGASWGGWKLHAAQELREAQVHFTQDCEATISSVVRGWGSVVDALHYLAGLHRASEEVTYEEFNIFSREMLARQPAIRALEWVPRVEDAQRGEFEARGSELVREHHGLRQFRIRALMPDGTLAPAERSDYYHPVLYVAPFEGNDLALGLDIGSEPARREALERAGWTGRAATSRCLRLVQEPAGRCGVLLALGVAERDPGRPGPSEEPPAGYYLAVVEIDSLVETALIGPGEHGVVLTITDVTEQESPRPLYRTPELKTSPWRLRVGREVEMSGRRWLIEGRPSLGYFREERGAWPLLTGVLCFLLPLGLGLYLAQQRRLRRGLTQAALYDPLTGLANRTLFTRRLEEAERRLRDGSDAGYSVLFMDIDRFKRINDTLGHAVGDELLVAVARRLEKLVPEPHLVARMGGDEFSVLLRNQPLREQAEDFSRRIDAELRRPFPLASGDALLGLSIGIATQGRDDEQAPVDALRRSDIAMVRAKQRGEDQPVAFDAKMHGDLLLRGRLEGDLRRAVDTAELQVLYQPIVQLENGRLVGFEALVRWQHPELGLLSPVTFIPVAEESGLIVRLGEYVMTRACRQLALWNRRRAAQHQSPLGVHVNVSGRQLLHPGFMDAVGRSLASASVAPSCLTLEITESVLMDDLDLGSRLLNELEQQGVKLCLDDFGTGYSSLSYLHRLPLSVLKVDQSFVHGLDDSNGGGLLVRTVVSLAKQLGFEVVAEGIERQEQREQLLDMGCDQGQGFLFGRAEAAETADMLVNGFGVETGTGTE